MSIKLSPTGTRENPDPSKFDNPISGARDVTPKTSIPATATTNPNQTGVINGDTKFWGTTNNGNVVQSTSLEAAAKAVLNYNEKSSYADIDPVATYGPTYSFSALQITASGSNPTSYTVLRTLYDSARPTLSWPRTVYMKGASAFPTSNPDYTASGGQSCPAGYTLNSSTSSCTLSDPAAVKKPANWPCEILRTNTGLQVDKANPNCDGVTLAGNSVSPSPDTSVSFNADGSVSVSNPNGQTTFQLGTPNPDGSVPIIGATRSGNPSSYTPGSTTTPSSCGGVGQPACSATGGSTAGSGLCGGIGQPSCGVTVSGFDGLGDPTATGKAALDTASNDRSNTLVNQTKPNSLNILSDWVPKPDITASCEPLVIPFMRATFTWDFCKYLPLLSQVMGYVFYIFAGMYIWKSFMGSNSPKGA